jgi:hypothetical protein
MLGVTLGAWWHMWFVITRALPSKVHTYTCMGAAHGMSCHSQLSSTASALCDAGCLVALVIVPTHALTCKANAYGTLWPVSVEHVMSKHPLQVLGGSCVL